MFAAIAGGGTQAAFAVDPGDLESRVTVAGVMNHLEALQTIADANSGNRAIGTPGYEASGAYIEGVLEAAGYTPVRQDFQATTQAIDEYEITLLGVTTDADSVDPAPARVPMEGTTETDPAGIVGAELVAPTTATGCDAAEWAGADATGKVAVVSRGVCAFSEKSLAAAAAGAVALLVYNSEDGPLNGTLGEQLPEYIPSIGITQAEGAAVLADLATPTPQTVDLLLQETTTTVDTFNIIAETPDSTRKDNVVMLGAHLDSVPEGPGINDNGSGSAAILETAVQLAASGTLNNTVRFAWWGAEEVGLVGSTHYVDDLVENDPEALDQIATYLNFDMVGSPNYVISVYDANESSFPAPVEVPEGSIATEAAFTDYFDSIGQPWIDTAFDGRSDYDAFIANDVPASGVFTGADDVKTAEQVALFGGTAGITQDPNYHQAGDDISNINTEALGISLGAIASVTASLANDTSAINGILPPVTEVPATTPPAVTEPAANGTAALAATGADDPLALAPLGLIVVATGVLLVGIRMRAGARRATAGAATGSASRD